MITPTAYQQDLAKHQHQHLFRLASFESDRSFASAGSLSRSDFQLQMIILLAMIASIQAYFAREKDRSKECEICSDVLASVVKFGNFDKDGLFQCALDCRRKHEGSFRR
jgi:hypothetical protein